jgi:pyruvate/2-oxoglutarate dehydrogenase complex dihydrolipoamide dehydrogenase (E3) component
VIPPIPGLDGTPLWTNRQAIETEQVPESLLVLGGGAVGAELAQVFARFGAQVSVVEPAERLISMEEPEAGDVLDGVFAREGIKVHCLSRAVAVEHDGNSFTVQIKGGEALTGTRLLVATGRRANLAAIGLDTVGLDPSARAIPVDGHMRAGEKLWAVGDCTGHGAFTHVAVYQARIAIADILGRPHTEASYHALPRVTFTDPEVGAVGLTERQAREQGIDVRCGATPMPASSRGWIHGPGNDGVIKLVEDRSRGVLVGATAMGPAGGEVFSLLAMAVHARVPVSAMRDMIYAYPTLHRGVEGALDKLAAA